ncbi:hypothetical protein AgCh_026292 [Apium graveolens]
MVAMNIVRVVLQALAWARSLQEMCVQDAAQISKLTQELEEAQSEVNLEKINQEMAERLVEKSEQEYIAELKSTAREFTSTTEKLNNLDDVPDSTATVPTPNAISPA